MDDSRIIFGTRVVFFLLLFLTGCASVKEVSNGIYEAGSFNESDRYIPQYRVANQKNANAKCSSQGKLADPIDEGRFSTMQWVLRFKCVDPAVIQQREKEALEASKREQDRRNQLAAEQAAKEQLIRKKQEDEARRYAEEWERTRPQREAEWRIREAEKNIRLNRICPAYSVARQSCATAAYYYDCMKIRMGKNYDSSDEYNCRSR